MTFSLYHTCLPPPRTMCLQFSSDLHESQNRVQGCLPPPAPSAVMLMVTVTSYSNMQIFESKELEYFALANITQFFELTRLLFDFHSNDPSQSEEDDTSLSCQLTTASLPQQRRHNPFLFTLPPSSFIIFFLFVPPIPLVHKWPPKTS